MDDFPIARIVLGRKAECQAEMQLETERENFGESTKNGTNSRR